MASKTNCIKNGIPYYRIRRTVDKKLNKNGIWVDDIKEFYGKNKKDAEAKYEAFKAKRSAGLSSEKQHFGIMLDFYIYKVFIHDGRFSPGTKERYEQVHRNYIKPANISGCSLEELKSIDIQQFYNTVNCSNATLRAIHNVMCHFYKYLEKEGYCRNLTSSLVLPKKKDTKSEAEKANSQNIVVWSDDEIRSIVQNLNTNRMRLLIILALNTGARISELLALQYTDIQDNKLYITKQLANVANIELNNKKTREFEIVKPKTTNSIRNIPLSDRVLDEIELHAAWHKKEMLQNGYRTDFIFTTQTGNFYDRQNVNRACKRYYKSIGVESKGFHTYRHTFCTNLCKNGVPIQTACKLMGHNNINVTAQFYTNIDDEQKIEAIDKITDIMF